MEEFKNLVLDDVHRDLGAKMVPFAGFNMPIQYSSVVEEHLIVRNAVGLFDVSHMGEYIIRGSGSLDLVQWLCSNDASKLKIGEAQYSYFPNLMGGIIDDVIVYRLDVHEYMLVVNASNKEKNWKWIESQNKSATEIVDISESLNLFALQGPKASAVLQKLTDFDLSAIRYYSFVKGTVADVGDVIISGTGYTGAGGFELYVNNKYAVHVWKEILNAGAEFDILPAGLGARDTLRIEAGYCLYGNDISETTSPFEAGLGWITKFTKPFVNSDYLMRLKSNGQSMKLVGFIMLDRGIPRKDYEILDEAKNVVGHVTSGTHSPVLDKGIGLGYINIALAEVGNKIRIRIRKKMIDAQIVKLPFVSKLK